MKLNYSKTKFVLFNPTLKFDFIPELSIEGSDIETVEKIKLLGIVLSNDLKWKGNTEEMVKKASSRLWMVKRLKKLGAGMEDLKDVFIKQTRSILEFGAPVWNSGITKEESNDIERVQKSFLYIVLQKEYTSYETALNEIGLETLKERRLKLCVNFARKAAKDPKHSHWFVPFEQCGAKTRSEKNHYQVPLGRLERFKNSPIPYLTNLLNEI